MSMEIRPLNLMETLILRSLASDAFVNLSVQTAISEHDEVIGLFEDETPIGIAVLLQRNCPDDGVEINCIHILGEHRSKGYTARFISLIAAYLTGRYKAVYFRLSETHSAYERLRGPLEKNGFRIFDSAEIMSCLINDENRMHWERTKAKYCTKILGWLTRQGFSCVSFSQADGTLLDKVLDEKSQEFDCRYNARHIYNGSKGKFLPEYSFIAAFKGEPAAITMMLEADGDSLIFQLISVAKEYRNSGAVLMPINASMEKAVQSGYGHISFCIYEYNTPMKKISHDIFDCMVNRRTKQLCYQCCLPE